MTVCWPWRVNERWIDELGRHCGGLLANSGVICSDGVLDVVNNADHG